MAFKNFGGLKINKIMDFNFFGLKMPHLKIRDAVATVPIVQGGMGVGISLSGLASAVSREGGIGVIAANAIGMLEPDYYTDGIEANKRALRKEIRKARETSAGLLGVNIMVALNDFYQLLQVSIEERVDIIFMGAGLPLKGIPLEELRNANIKVVPIVSSGRAANLIFKYWQKQYGDVPDAVVVEGPQAGGHLGFKPQQIDDPDFALEKLIPEVVDEIKPFEVEFDRSIPVIAAGGIFTGKDIYKFIHLGASGVQMATRFVATEECDADRRFKESYVNCQEGDIVIIKSPVGLPGRAIKNSFLNEVEAGMRKKFRCAWKCLEHCNAQQTQYCISQALNNARLGKMAHGFTFAGANAYRVNNIVSVKSLMEELKNEYSLMVDKETAILRNEFEDALKKLMLMKDEYLNTVQRHVRALKLDVEEILEKGNAAFHEEFLRVVAKLDTLKAEYGKHLDKVNELKTQLSRFFDISSLKLSNLALY